MKKTPKLTLNPELDVRQEAVEYLNGLPSDNNLRRNEAKARLFALFYGGYGDLSGLNLLEDR